LGESRMLGGWERAALLAEKIGREVDKGCSAGWK